MTILYPTPAAVKSPRPMFAAGLVPARRTRIAGPSLADRRWAAAELNRAATDYVVTCPGHAVLDQWAGESAALDAAERHLSFV